MSWDYGEIAPGIVVMGTGYGAFCDF